MFDEPRSAKWYATALLAFAALVFLTLTIFNGLDKEFERYDQRDSPSTTSVAEKWGCQPGEIIVFGDPYECVSEDEWIEQNKPK